MVILNKGLLIDDIMINSLFFSSKMGIIVLSKMGEMYETSNEKQSKIHEICTCINCCCRTF